MSTDLVACPACGSSLTAGQRFCEACGAPLPEPALVATCASCSAAGAGADGYCTECGARLPQPRDHVEDEGRGIAGVTDRGRRHHRNEDAMAFDDEHPTTVVAVVCDGVST